MSLKYVKININNKTRVRPPTNCRKSMMNCHFFKTNKNRKLENRSKIANLQTSNKNGMSPISNIKAPWIIHIFALLHAAVALGCRLAGLEDELLLTILTMTMAMILCLKRGLNIEFTAASIIVVNIFGYLIGNLGANLLQTFISSSEAVHSLSTFCTTEILGWSIMALTKIFNISDRNRKNVIDSPYLSLLILAMCGIFVFRLGIVFLFSTETFVGSDISTEVFSNSFSLITLICLNFIYIRYIRRYRRIIGRITRVFIMIGFMLLATLLETVLVGLGLPSGDNFRGEFPVLFATALLAQITVYCLVFMINYALSARSEMKEEREKANMAQYRYIKLKHQVSPHFLFNSLNILDGLICDGMKDRASTYTHKLAGIYRYMLKSEEEMIVPLRDELVFVNLYVDLLKERFPAGFEVRIDVPEEFMGKFVLPCSLQLLIENATKHNALNEEDPLIIQVKAAEESIMVTNNIIPKMNQSPSTGLGQTYIRQMYFDITGKQIDIEKTDHTYRVTLPLIQ